MLGKDELEEYDRIPEEGISEGDFLEPLEPIEPTEFVDSIDTENVGSTITSDRMLELPVWKWLSITSIVIIVAIFSVAVPIVQNSFTKLQTQYDNCIQEKFDRVDRLQEENIRLRGEISKILDQRE